MSVRSDSFVINRLSLRLTNFFGEGLLNSVQISGEMPCFPDRRLFALYPSIRSERFQSGTLIS